jgi:tripartite-type tricarboxylate transporter receptor subunit TctC
VPFIFDYAKSEEDRQIFQLVFGWLDLERPIAAPPGAPADRVQALREAFDKTMKDPALLAEAEKMHLEISPMTGETIAKFVERVTRTPASVTSRAARVLERTK